MSQIVYDFACVFSGVFTVDGENIQSRKAKIVRSAVTVSALQHFSVEVPLNAHVGVRIRLDSALVVRALGFYKFRGSI